MCLFTSFVLVCAMQDGGTQKRLVHFNDTSITTITVFATGAEVTRLVQLEAPVAGNVTIVLLGLPAQLEEGSVRVTADAGALHVRGGLQPGERGEFARKLNTSQIVLGIRISKYGSSG